MPLRVPYPRVEDVPVDTLNFSQMYNADGKMRVDLSYGPDKKKYVVNLCADATSPFEAKYPLDALRDDAADRTRRGQKIFLPEERAHQALEALDEAVIQAAIDNASDWFKTKTPLSNEDIRNRYQKTVFVDREGDPYPCMKFKVKMPDAKVPTKLHLSDKPNQGTVDALEMPGAMLCPIVSSFGLWFMGGKEILKFGLSFQAEEMIITPGSKKDPFTSYPCIQDVLPETIVFGAMYKADGKMRVDISHGAAKKQFRVRLCTDMTKPCEAKYPLDMVREDAQDKTRRGQKIFITEECTRRALEALDEAVIQAAINNAGDWFKSKSPPSNEEIRNRYQKTLFFDREGDPYPCMKFKVKVGDAKVPTKLHLTPGDEAATLNDIELPGAMMVPIVSSFGLWFMGGKDPLKFGLSFQAEDILVTPGQELDAFAGFVSKRSKIEADESDAANAV